MSRVFIQAEPLTLVCRTCGKEEPIPAEFMGQPFEWVVFIETREAIHQKCFKPTNRTAVN